VGGCFIKVILVWLGTPLGEGGPPVHEQSYAVSARGYGIYPITL